MKYVLSLALFLPLAALVPVVVLGFRGRPAPVLAAQAGAVVACAALGAIYLGGDFMAMGRLLVVATPFLALLFALSCAHVAGPDGSRGRRAWLLAVPCVAASLLVALGVDLVPRSWFRRLDYRWGGISETELERWHGMRDLAVLGKRLGRALERHTRPGESLVRGAIGALGYETELFLHDRYGLVDREVARRDASLLRSAPGHDKRVEATFFLERRPTYLDASIRPAGEPVDGRLPKRWRDEEWASRVEVERIALDAAEGFEPGTELRLVRLRWD